MWCHSILKYLRIIIYTCNCYSYCKLLQIYKEMSLEILWVLRYYPYCSNFGNSLPTVALQDVKITFSCLFTYLFYFFENVTSQGRCSWVLYVGSVFLQHKSQSKAFHCTYHSRLHKIYITNSSSGPITSLVLYSLRKALQ